MELTPDATTDFNTDETVANVDESIQSSDIDVDKEATPEEAEAETEPDKKINLWLISGIPAGVIVLAVTVWLINKRRY